MGQARQGAGQELEDKEEIVEGRSQEVTPETEEEWAEDVVVSGR